MMHSDKKCNAEEDVVNIISDITNLKVSLVEYITSQHSTFADQKKGIRQLADQFDMVHMKAIDVIGDCEKTCHDLFYSTEDREKYMRQIESLRTLRTTVIDLLELDKHVTILEELVYQEFVLSVEKLHNLSVVLITIDDVLTRSSWSLRRQDLRVYQIITENLVEIKMELKQRVKNVWDTKIILDNNGKNAHFNYKDPINNGGLIPVCKRIIFDLNTDILRELISLMFSIELGYQNLKLLLISISEELIDPILLHFDTFSLVTSTANSKLSITLNSRLRDETASLVDRANTFLDSLINTFVVIHKELLCIAIDPHKSKTNALIKEMQIVLFDELLTAKIIKHFLPELFSVHKEMVERLYTFNDQLIEYGYIRPDNITLREYIDNIGHHARQNDHTNLLSNCRRLYMTSILTIEQKPVSDIMTNLREVGSREIFQELPGLAKFINLEPMVFPKCTISRHTNVVMNIVNDTFSLYEDKSQRKTVEIMDFLRMLPDIMMLYLSVVPVFSSLVLEDVPQAAALHYNNCMYIAHHCMVLSPTIKNLVDDLSTRLAPLDPHDNITCLNAPDSLLRVVYVMRDAAYKALTVEVNKQKEYLDDFLGEVDTFIGIGDKEHRVGIDKMLNKCYLHLSNLSKAYGVLAQSVYDGVFGGIIMNHVLSAVTDKVIKMPDIVQTDNRGIVATITDFCHKLLDIVSYQLGDGRYDADGGTEEDSNDKYEAYMVQHVPSWEKVRTLLSVLNRNLIEIDDLYSDGKAVAHNRLSDHELRSLIRALFRNSAMRARVLDRIV